MDLIDRAIAAAHHAYAPYSSFRVGAAVEGESGQVYVGCNVENAAYASTMCAEANAVGNAIAAGEKRLVRVAVACIDAEQLDGAYPCGNCRQILNEFGAETVEVTDGSGETRQHRLADLLPHGFEL